MKVLALSSLLAVGKGLERAGMKPLLVAKNKFVDYNDFATEAKSQRELQQEAKFEFEDLLSYSYSSGEAATADSSASAGGFPEKFFLANMNFGESDTMMNSGRGDGYYVEAARFRGFLTDGYLGIAVGGGGDANGDGVDDVLIGAIGAETAYLVLGEKEDRRRLEVAALDQSISEVDKLKSFTVARESQFLNGEFAENIQFIGDFNGDGYDDFAIGEPSRENNKGRAYILFGSDSLPSVTDIDNDFGPKKGFYIHGQEEGDRFGISIAGAGDLNGDGFDDVIIGSDNKDENGAGLIIFGSDARFPSGQAYHKFARQSGGFEIRIDPSNKEDQRDSRLGSSVASVGDFNGDGYDDLAIAAAEYNRRGAVFILYGGPRNFDNFNTADSQIIYIDSLIMGDAKKGTIIYGENRGDFFGTYVSGAGDFNGDGYSDFIVGAPAYEAENKGAVYLVFGRQAQTKFIDYGAKWIGENANDGAGWQVAGIGDLDGDGLDDVIVSALLADIGDIENAGAVYVIFGGTLKKGDFLLAALDGFDGFAAYGSERNELAGVAIDYAGDFDFDGRDDVIVGAAVKDVLGSSDDALIKNGGAAFVIFGKTISSKAPTLLPTGPSSMPTPVPSRGKIRTDLCDSDESSFPASINLDNCGECDRSAMLNSTSGAISAIALAGDVDNDGIDDLLVAANSKAYLVYGTNTEDNFPNQVAVEKLISSMTTGEYPQQKAVEIDVGCDVDGLSAAGDVNDDGFDDITIACSTERNRGVVYLILGGGDLGLRGDVDLETDLVAGTDYVELRGRGDVRFRGEGSEGQQPEFGKSMSFLDFNGDGYSDVVVGSPGANEAYVWYGSASESLKDRVEMHKLKSDEGLTVYFGRGGAFASAQLGAGVAGVGDLNADGYEDVVIGAPGVGWICVALGNIFESKARYDCSSPQTFIPSSDTPGFASKFSNLQDSDEVSMFGYSVAAAGDVDGDGVADFVVGAPSADHDGGQAFLFYGRGTEGYSADGFENAKHATVFSSTLRLGSLGAAVAGAGDVNNDGYDDVLLGADHSMSNLKFVNDAPGTAYLAYGAQGLKKLGNQGSIDVRDEDAFSGVTLTATALGARNGGAVALGGYDLDNDEVDDLVVAQLGAGTACVIFGNDGGTDIPTSYPTYQPSSVPTAVPTTEPTSPPTALPSYVPSPAPSEVPTADPTSKPSAMPSYVPSYTPTGIPTAPSAMPTVSDAEIEPPTSTEGDESASPTRSPTPSPTRGPTLPTPSPTYQPTLPTPSPTYQPTLPTPSPTYGPTVPTPSPTMESPGGMDPVPSPTYMPTTEMDTIPIQEPTIKPSESPGPSMSPEPTSAPTYEPTYEPTMESMRGDDPTAAPTIEAPTPVPTTASPTSVPTTGSPTMTHSPTGISPTVVTPEPTAVPSPNPTPLPSPEPTALPDFEPTATASPTSTPAPTATASPTAIIAPTATASPTATAAPIAIIAPTATASPTSTPAPSGTMTPTGVETMAPSTVDFRFQNAQEGFVIAVLRISNMTEADMGDAEFNAVAAAILDVLGPDGEGLINSTSDIRETTATDIASIDLSFFSRLEPPSAYGNNKQEVTERVYGALSDATDSGFLNERLSYWSDYYDADSDLASLDTDITTDDLLADPDGETDFFFELPLPSPSPTISIAPVIPPTPSPTSTPVPTATPAPSNVAALVPSLPPVDIGVPVPTIPGDGSSGGGGGSKKKSNNNNAGLLAAIIIPIVVVLLCCCCIIYYFCFASRDKDEPDDEKLGDEVDDRDIQAEGEFEEPITNVDEAHVGVVDDGEGGELAVIEDDDKGEVQEKIMEADL